MSWGSRQQDGDVECERWDGDTGIGWRHRTGDGMEIRDAGMGCRFRMQVVGKCGKLMQSLGCRHRTGDGARCRCRRRSRMQVQMEDVG